MIWIHWTCSTKPKQFPFLFLLYSMPRRIQSILSSFRTPCIWKKAKDLNFERCNWRNASGKRVLLLGKTQQTISTWLKSFTFLLQAQTIVDVFKTFQTLVDSFQEYWNTYNSLTKNTWLIDPEHPRRRDSHCRIIIGEIALVV